MVIGSCGISLADSLLALLGCSCQDEAVASAVVMVCSSRDMWGYVMLARTQMCGAMGNGGSGVARTWVSRAVSGLGGSNMDVGSQLSGKR